MFFETHHSSSRHYFRMFENESNGFPLHIHRAFECYQVISGCAYAIINGEEYELYSNEAVLVFPYQSHEYKTTPGTITRVCIFSPDLVGSFNKDSHTIPKCNKFIIPFEKFKLPDNIFLKKALCYQICGIFDETAEYIQKNTAKDDLLSKILIYISNNYTTSCTLEEVSKHVGYDYSYLSKFFKKSTGISFKTYVNNLRISKACRLLSHKEFSIQEISDKCGFGCTRTFNREFRNMIGKTPSEYLNSEIEIL